EVSRRCGKNGRPRRHEPGAGARFYAACSTRTLHPVIPLNCSTQPFPFRSDATRITRTKDPDLSRFLTGTLLKNRYSVLPGFGLTLGFSVLYLGLVVLIPLAGTFLKTATLSWQQFIDAVTAQRVLASLRLSFGASLLAAFINLFAGALIA